MWHDVKKNNDCPRVAYDEARLQSLRMAPHQSSRQDWESDAGQR